MHVPQTQPGTAAWAVLWTGDYLYVGDMARGPDTFRYTGAD